MLDKFRQCGEFFSAIEVVKITRILDFNVRYSLAIPSVIFKSQSRFKRCIIVATIVAIEVKLQEKNLAQTHVFTKIFT